MLSELSLWMSYFFPAQGWCDLCYVRVFGLEVLLRFFIALVLAYFEYPLFHHLFGAGN